MCIWKIALLMSDMKAAEALYVGKLGLKVLKRLDLGELGECIYLDGGGVQLELIPQAAFKGAPNGLDMPGMHHISFRSGDVAADAEQWQAAGVPVIKEPFESTPGVTLAFFEGLDGVRVQLYHDRNDPQT